RDLESAIEPIARLHTPLARLHAALRLVQRRLKTNVRELGQRNTAHDFITRRGNRALLLKLLLDRLSIPNVLALVRPFSRLMQPAELPDPSVFEHPVLRVRLGTRTIWLDPAWIGAPLGYLMPGLQGRPALLLSPFPRSPLDGSKTPTLAQTPRGSIDDEGRTIVAAGHLESSGQLALQVEERLRGRVAVSYRRFLLSRGHEQRRKAIERVLRVWFPEAKLRKLEILDLQRNEKPLRLRYHASGRLAPSISLGFAGLYEIEELSRVARRRQALLIENPRHVDLTIRLAVEPQLVVRHPTVQTIVGPGLRFQIADELTEGKGITIRRRFVLRSGRLAPARYPELLRGLRRIIGIETISFERRR
ncbi:MAG: hypothetical protein KC609_04220, partial [Myxococcales bacterium]|nr:hypothetical protein [Myxococcales bacterium]